MINPKLYANVYVACVEILLRWTKFDCFGYVRVRIFWALPDRRRARLLDIEQALVTVSGLCFFIKWFTCTSIYFQMISNDFDLLVIMRFTVDYCWYLILENCGLVLQTVVEIWCYYWHSFGVILVLWDNGFTNRHDHASSNSLNWWSSTPLGMLALMSWYPFLRQ